MKIYHIEFDIDCAFNLTDSIPNFNNLISALGDDLSIIGRDIAYQKVFSNHWRRQYSIQSLSLHNLNILFMTEKAYAFGTWKIPLRVTIVLIPQLCGEKSPIMIGIAVMIVFIIVIASSIRRGQLFLIL